MEFDEPNGVMDYEKFKEFWGEEIEEADEEEKN